MKEQILIVEDDLAMSGGIRDVLDMAGYKVQLAENGQEAIDLCRDNPDIDLVLMDIKMPVVDGLEATREIRKFRPALPVIAITAYAQTGDQERCLAAGCSDYIAKPVKRADLSARLATFGFILENPA